MAIWDIIMILGTLRMLTVIETPGLFMTTTKASPSDPSSCALGYGYFSIYIVRFHCFRKMKPFPFKLCSGVHSTEAEMTNTLFRARCYALCTHGQH